MNHTTLTSRGMGLLCSHIVGAATQSHADWLLGQVDPSQGAVVAYMGCGIGALARSMLESRPDLKLILVNNNPEQAKDCARDVLVESFHRTSIDTGSCDVVLFHWAFVHADRNAAMAEAKRVLRPGGKLVLYEPVGNVEGWSDILPGSVLHSEPSITESAAALGFDLASLVFPESDTTLCKDVLTDIGEAHIFDATFAKVKPALFVFLAGESEIDRVFKRHSKVALSFSGGKDSLALLHLMRPYWDRLTVYWLNPGNPFPETVALMDQVRTMVPNFKEIAGRQPEIIASDGWPSDVVPQGHTTDGNAVFGATPFKVQTRLSCCFRALMWPAYEAMLADGVDCIMRGKRADEADKTGVESGFISDGIELIFPLMQWTAADVVSYLRAADVRLPKFYEHAGHSLDCMDCTAWWGEGLSEYLRHEHPIQFVEYKRRVGLIKFAVAEQLLKCEV